MPPASYQSLAESIYNPQQQAESNSLDTNHTNTISQLEGSKSYVAQNYNEGIQNLKDSVKAQTGQIDSLYNSRLLGNISGLQGNDMGMMYAKANQQQANIETTRANKLAQITGAETAANNTYTTSKGNLGLKYSSLKSKYASDAYNSDVKDARAQSNSDRSYNLAVFNANKSAGNADTAAAGKYKVAYKTTGGGDKAYTGPNGSTNLYQYAQGVNGGAKAGADQVLQTIKEQLTSGSSIDKNTAAYITTAQRKGASTADIIKQLSKTSSYIFQ